MQKIVLIHGLQALEGKDVKDLLLNVGSGGGAAAAPTSGGATSGGADAAEETKEEEKEEGMVLSYVLPYLG
jgi:ribosomal protein L12E/L44/L45/RPP1/RPP2